jgi:hypothetical protein
MADVSYTWNSFLGGEWSVYAQGRADLPQYKTAMSTCFNAYPVEEGAWVRRPGSAFLQVTNGGGVARVLPFFFSDPSPYIIEATSNTFRFYTGDNIVMDNDLTTISAITPNGTGFIFTTAGNVPWTTGTSIKFFLINPFNASDLASVQNRVFHVTVLSSTTFSCADAVTGQPLVGLSANELAGFSTTAVSSVVSAASVLTFSTPYPSTSLAQLRAVTCIGAGVQGFPLSFLLHPNFPPQSLQVVEFPVPGQNFATFKLSNNQQLPFTDGPYLDPVAGAQFIQSGNQFIFGYTAFSATTVYALNTIVTSAGIDYISLIDGNLNNTPASSPSDWAVVPPGSAIGPNGFQATDVGRALRAFSEPAVWNPATSYNLNDQVTFNGVFYVNILNPNVGLEPDTHPGHWQINASVSAATWTWFVITAVISANTVSMAIKGPSLLFTPTTANPIVLWQLGVYSNTTGWPAIGAFWQGRLWLAAGPEYLGGGNRVDASSSDDIFNFAPTAADGTVGDANGLSLVFNAADVNTIYWLEPNSQGLLCGTRAGEWLIQATQQGDPITPFSAQASRVTLTGTADGLGVVKTPLTIVAIHKFRRQIFEFFPDVFSGKTTAPPINQYAKHLTVGLAEELAYQSDITPIIWARMGDGSLAGCTYRRVSSFSNVEPAFVGWHRHQLGASGSARVVQSICVGPSFASPGAGIGAPVVGLAAAGTRDTLFMVTQDTTTSRYQVEALTDLFDVGAVLNQAWHLDAAVVPSGGQVTTGLSGQQGVLFFGLHHLNPPTASSVVSCWVNGVDAGDAQVLNGAVFVPFNGAFTLALLQQGVTEPPSVPAAHTTTIQLAFGAAPSVVASAVIGYNYTSQGQLVRPEAPQDAGAQNGPALGKVRRLHKFAALFGGAVSDTVSFGTDFSVLRPATFYGRQNQDLGQQVIYTGVHRNNIDDEYSLDGQICWQVSRPYPCTLAMVGGFINTQDE